MQGAKAIFICRLALAAAWMIVGPTHAHAQAPNGDLAAGQSAVASPPQAQPAGQPPLVTCSSKPGEREHCPADTSRGVVLARSQGEAPCLLGKTWGYDDEGIWV